MFSLFLNPPSSKTTTYSYIQSHKAFHVKYFMVYQNQHMMADNIKTSFKLTERNDINKFN